MIFENDIHLSCVLMVKNEQARIFTTLFSLVHNDIPIVNSVCMYDTGSTDETISITKKFCEDYNILLRLITSETHPPVFLKYPEDTEYHGYSDFDYAATRNILLDYVDTFDDIDFLLFMDANDELKGGKELREILPKMKDMDTSAFLMKHVLENKTKKLNITSFYQFRIIRPRKGMRYQGYIHESLANIVSDSKVMIRPSIFLYQDRKYDDEKSISRCDADVRRLKYMLHLKMNIPRTLFLLGQTYDMSGQHLQAYDWFIRRYKNTEGGTGIKEELFNAVVRIGAITQEDNPKRYNEDELYAALSKWYMIAYRLFKRAEPLINLAIYHISHRDWKMAYAFSKVACSLDYPSEAIYYVEDACYNYIRWKLYAQAAFNAGYVDEGLEPLQKAYDYAISNNFDVESVVAIKDVYDDNVSGRRLLKNLTSSERYKKFLFLGVPQSGVEWIPESVSGIGYERMGEDGIASWIYAIAGCEGDYYNIFEWNPSATSPSYNFYHIIHIVSDPLINVSMLYKYFVMNTHNSFKKSRLCLEEIINKTSLRDRYDRCENEFDYTVLIFLFISECIKKKTNNIVHIENFGYELSKIVLTRYEDVHHKLHSNYNLGMFEWDRVSSENISLLDDYCKEYNYPLLSIRI